MSRHVDVLGYGECGSGMVRGLNIGDTSDVRICFVVIWKNNGWFVAVCSESVISCCFLFADCEFFSGGDFMCLSNALNAFVSYTVISM